MHTKDDPKTYFIAEESSESKPTSSSATRAAPPGAMLAAALRARSGTPLVDTLSRGMMVTRWRSLPFFSSALAVSAESTTTCDHRHTLLRLCQGGGDSCWRLGSRSREQHTLSLLLQSAYLVELAPSSHLQRRDRFRLL